MVITFQSLSHTHGAEHFSNSTIIIACLPKILVAIHLNKQTILILLFKILKKNIFNIHFSDFFSMQNNQHMLFVLNKYSLNTGKYSKLN